MSSTGILENPTQLIYPRLHLHPCLRWVLVRATTSADTEDYSQNPNQPSTYRMFTWEAKSSVHIKFRFGCISKRCNILMDMGRHFISGSVYIIFYQLKWNFIPIKMTDMKSIAAIIFKRTCALNTTSNESAFIHFASGKLCSHENLVPVWNFILVKMADMKSIPFWLSFCLNSWEQK